MPQRNVNITDQQDQFVAAALRSGRYNSASEVIREALRMLQAREKADEIKLERLRFEVQKGVDAYERGDYITLSGPEEISAYFSDVERRGRERLARERTCDGEAPKS